MEPEGRKAWCFSIRLRSRGARYRSSRAGDAVFGQAQSGGLVSAADQYGFLIVVPQPPTIAGTSASRTRAVEPRRPSPRCEMRHRRVPGARTTYPHSFVHCSRLAWCEPSVSISVEVGSVSRPSTSPEQGGQATDTGGNPSAGMTPADGTAVVPPANRYKGAQALRRVRPPPARAQAPVLQVTHQG